MNRMRRITATVAGAALFGAGVLTANLLGASAHAQTSGPVSAAVTLPGFSRAVFLSHLNAPNATPGFPGDPAFKISTAFTVPADGYYLQYVQEGEHTGTHWGAPCHFHVGAACAGQLDPSDLILPAVVVDIREQVQNDVDYQATIADMKAWEAANGPMPQGAAVILYTGCSTWWADGHRPGTKNYYNCGTGERGFHQPGFALRTVKWLVDQNVLSDRGALGTDTFGPDPGTDERFRESSLVFHRHRIDLENLANVGSLPASGSWIVVGGPRNAKGSGSPATIYGLIP
jgi:kynurenine formamidase